MDLHNIYRNWGITATPVIDVATNTIYVTTFGKPNAASQNTERNNMLWILDANTLADKKPPVLIEGNADNGGGGIANGFTTPYQKMRAGLGLLTDAGGNKAVVVSFSINGENPRGPGHGFVVAYDVRGLNRDAGFTPTPAIWNVTPGGGAGGVWMSGSGPAIDGDDIYLATGNGMDPGTMPGNFGESFVKLRYTAGVAGVNNGKPKLAVVDYWGAFSDFRSVAGREGSGPWRRRGRPDPRARQPHRRRQRWHSLQPEQEQPREEHLGSPVQSAVRRNVSPQRAERRRGSPDDDRARSELADRQSRSQPPAQTPAGKSYHIHGTPVYMERATSGIVYVWGENERLKAYNFNFATKRITAFRGEGTQVASGNMPAPGGMPGGRLVVSSNGTTSRHRRCLGHVPGARECERRGRSRRARRVRCDDGRQRQAEAAFPQRREPCQQHGELCQVLHAGGGERESLCRDVQQQGRPVRPLRRRQVPPSSWTYVQRPSERGTA